MDDASALVCVEGVWDFWGMRLPDDDGSDIPPPDDPQGHMWTLCMDWGWLLMTEALLPCEPGTWAYLWAAWCWRHLHRTVHSMDTTKRAAAGVNWGQVEFWARYFPCHRPDDEHYWWTWWHFKHGYSEKHAMKNVSNRVLTKASRCSSSSSWDGGDNDDVCDHPASHVDHVDHVKEKNMMRYD